MTNVAECLKSRHPEQCTLRPVLTLTLFANVSLAWNPRRFSRRDGDEPLPEAS